MDLTGIHTLLEEKDLNRAMLRNQARPTALQDKSRFGSRDTDMRVNLFAIQLDHISATILVAVDPSAKSSTFRGFSGKPNLISTKKLKSKDPTQCPTAMLEGDSFRP